MAQLVARTAGGREVACSNQVIPTTLNNRGVAQLGSAHRSGRWGRLFKSGRPDQINTLNFWWVDFIYTFHFQTDRDHGAKLVPWNDFFALTRHFSMVVRRTLDTNDQSLESEKG